MISKTKIHRIGGSLMVVIPDAFVKYSGINKNGKLASVKIEDISKSEFRLQFE